LKFFSAPEVDFTNILQAAFMPADPKSVKRQSSHQCLLALLESTHVKAGRKTLVKSTPEVLPLHFLTTFANYATLVLNHQNSIKNSKTDLVVLSLSGN